MPLKVILASHSIVDVQLQPAGKKLPVQQITSITCTVDYKYYLYSGFIDMMSRIVFTTSAVNAYNTQTIGILTTGN